MNTHDEKNKDIIAEQVKELKGLSWYEAEEKLRKECNRKSVTRIVFVSLITQKEGQEGSTDDTTTIVIASTLHDFFSSFMSLKDDDGCARGRLFGGIVLASVGRDKSEATSALGFLELDSATIAYECIREMGQSRNLGLDSIRILLVSDDCPCNDFGPFGVYLASPPTEDNVDIEKEGPAVVFSNIMKNLCKECKSFHVDSEIYDDTQNIKILNGKNRKSIPSAVRISNCAQCQCYPALEEYLRIFYSPTYYELDSEKMSPLMRLIDWEEVLNIVSSSSK